MHWVLIQCKPVQILDISIWMQNNAEYPGHSEHATIKYHKTFVQIMEMWTSWIKCCIGIDWLWYLIICLQICVCLSDFFDPYRNSCIICDSAWIIIIAWNCYHPLLFMHGKYLWSFVIYCNLNALRQKQKSDYIQICMHSDLIGFWWCNKSYGFHMI